MDSPQEFKKTHFSISTFKRSKPKISIIENDEKNPNNDIRDVIKRSSSYVIPKKFVPKLKPIKNVVNPSFFILNENNDNLNTEIKSVLNDEDLSFSSLSDSSSLEEEKISDKMTDLDEHEDNSLSSLFNIRKKMQRIKYNSRHRSIKECANSRMYQIKKKYNLDDCYCYFDKLKNKKISLDNEFYNFDKYKSKPNLLYCNNKDKSKGHKNTRPFLIFDVLVGASVNNL